MGTVWPAPQQAGTLWQQIQEQQRHEVEHEHDHDPFRREAGTGLQTPSQAVNAATGHQKHTSLYSQAETHSVAHEHSQRQRQAVNLPTEGSPSMSQHPPDPDQNPRLKRPIPGPAGRMQQAIAAGQMITQVNELL